MSQVYQKTITTNPNTNKDNPLITQVLLVSGVVKSLGIYFPFGHGGLTGVSFFTYTHQIYPSERDTWFIGNDLWLVLNTSVNIDTDPYLLEIRTYNTDSVYPHTFYITIEIEEFTQKGNIPTPSSEFIKRLADRKSRRK